MASTSVKSNRMKRIDSKKSHSWWWDSHISPKNSKWLQENLEEMDQHVKRMLKLIEEDADSFAKKAEMYYQKRPELISLVEEFYRMYRSLAERYDHVTGELRKNIPSDLQSQCSGISDVGSEPPSTLPSPDRRPSRKSGPRAAGFDFFLGSGENGSEMHNNNNSNNDNNNNNNNKEEDESSTLDSESESDDSSSVHNVDEQGLRLKIIQLEVELREVKEKLCTQESGTLEGSFGKCGNEYEEELQVAREKVRLSEKEINRLMVELQKFEFLGNTNNLISASPHKIQIFEEELRITLEKLQKSEDEVASLRQELTSKGFTTQYLQDQLKSAQEELSVWKNKLDRVEREVSKLHDRVARYKTNLSDRDQEIRALKEAMSNANKSLSEENARLQVEVTRITKERTHLEDNLKEMDLRCQSFREDVRRVKAGNAEMEDIFRAQIKQLEAQVAEKNEYLKEIKKNLDALWTKYEMLMAEKDDISINTDALAAEVSSKDDQIDEMSKHLHQLHVEHVDLIVGAEGARKLADELRIRIKELEKEVERKQEIILEGAEEKREAIRQLCFSLEHYRNGYNRLRQAVIGHKGLSVMAS